MAGGFTQGRAGKGEDEPRWESWRSGGASGQGPHVLPRAPLVAYGLAPHVVGKCGVHGVGTDRASLPRILCGRSFGFPPADVVRMDLCGHP